MKALVTGATGFIGSFLARELQNRGFTVRALVLPEEKAGTLKRSGIEIRRGDLTNEGSLAGLCDGVDIVFHLAVMGRNNDVDASLARMTLAGKAVFPTRRQCSGSPDGCRSITPESKGRRRAGVHAAHYMTLTMSTPSMPSSFFVADSSISPSISMMLYA